MERDKLYLTKKDKIIKTDKKKNSGRYEIGSDSVLCNNFKNSVVSSNFPHCLKLAGITASYTLRTIKENYRPVSILTNQQQFLKKLYLHKWLCSLKSFFIDINVVLKRMII